MNYRYEQKGLSSQNGAKYHLYEDSKRLSFEEVIDLWIEDGNFRKFYNDLLKNSEIETYFWEHPPNLLATIKNDYEFVLVESKSLSRIKADWRAFRNYVNTVELVVDFKNLRGEAHLISPSNQEDKAIDYSSLGRFVRSGTEAQVDEFWKRVGEKYKVSLGEKWKWLSTSGLGVYWLHVRIDSQPKYYTHSPYRRTNLTI